jgi:glycine hydroxymethyltransferase
MVTPDDPGRPLEPDEVLRRLDELVAENLRIHEVESLNLDPASNVMNPRAEALLSAGLGTRPSLGLPGAKYETGLEAIERIELLADDLARQVFGAAHVELRVPSGAIANLYAFMATCRPGDSIIVPPATIGGHVTHHGPGAAGLYGLDIHEAPIDPATLTIDVDGLADLADRIRPKLITAGGSLNLARPPVEAIRAVADSVGARVLFDAAHLSGMFAGRQWTSPLEQGAHLMTMSTYKSLGGPPAGLVCTDDDELASRIVDIAHPGLTANFDVAKTAAMVVTLADWIALGAEYAEAMVTTARTMAGALAASGVPVVEVGVDADRYTASHHVAVDATAHGGGNLVAGRLRRANLLACGIGLPPERCSVGRFETPGLRLGTPEMVRWGMGPGEAEQVAGWIARAFEADDGELDVIGSQVSALRRRFDRIHFVSGGPVAPR